jgi:hypothetical protein
VPVQIISCEESFMSAILQCNQKHFKQIADTKIVQAKESDDEITNLSGVKAQIELLSLGRQMDSSEKTQSAN